MDIKQFINLNFTEEGRLKKFKTLKRSNFYMEVQSLIDILIIESCNKF